MNNNLSISFNQKLVSNGILTIDIEMIDNNKPIDINFFLSDYRISKIFYGKFFIKRLIKKIFKYQLNQNMKWSNDFWNKVNINLKNTKFSIVTATKDLPSDFNKQSSYKQNLVYENIIHENTPENRFRDIKKYQRLIENGIDLGPPLYISGRCFNFLGANIDPKDIFILDGSRRLVANILNGINPDVLLIDIKVD